jgi:hypothetical protein
LVVNGGWVFSGIHGDTVDGVTELTAAAATLARGPRGGIGFGLRYDWASASPQKARTADETMILIHIQFPDFISTSPYLSLSDARSI